MSAIREAIVAGQFYPGLKSELIKEIASFSDPKATKSDVIACMLPHAGYVYSGRVAVEAVSRINIKDKIILLGPNHTGLGQEFSLMSDGAWQTPLGSIKIDSVLAKEILSQSKYLKEDALAHLNEHSLEVELPILQYFRNDFQIVPIALMSSDIKALKAVGQEIAAAVKGLKSVMLIASSDMTHYESQEIAIKKDNAAIKAILDLDEDALADRIRALNISMCGYAPVIVMISAAKALGAKKTELIKYQTSGDVTGDKTSVVGYASIVIR